MLKSSMFVREPDARRHPYVPSYRTDLSQNQLKFQKSRFRYELRPSVELCAKRVRKKLPKSGKDTQDCPWALQEVTRTVCNWTKISQNEAGPAARPNSVMRTDRIEEAAWRAVPRA